MGVDLDSHLAGFAGVTPDHGIVSDDASGRVVECCLNRVARCRGDVDGGNHPLDLLGSDHAAVHTHHLVGFGANLQAVDRGIAVSQREMALLGKKKIVLEVGGELLIEAETLGVEGYGLGGTIVGSQNGGVASAVS